MGRSFRSASATCFICATLITIPNTIHPIKLNNMSFLLKNEKREQKRADATEHQRCSFASAYSLTSVPAVGRVTLYLVIRISKRSTRIYPLCQSAVTDKSSETRFIYCGKTESDHCGRTLVGGDLRRCFPNETPVAAFFAIFADRFTTVAPG